MTTQERLEAIQALTKAASQLSDRNLRNHPKRNLVMAISEIQNALKALKIDAIKYNACVRLAKKL